MPGAIDGDGVLERSDDANECVDSRRWGWSSNECTRRTMPSVVPESEVASQRATLGAAGIEHGAF